MFFLLGPFLEKNGARRLGRKSTAPGTMPVNGDTGERQWMAQVSILDCGTVAAAKSNAPRPLTIRTPR